MYKFTAQTARKLIDKYLSLQWCKDNLIIPISIESNPNSNNDIFWIAIANYAYLGTLAEPMKSRMKQDDPNIEIIFIEKSFEEIGEMLDKASDLDK